MRVDLFLSMIVYFGQTDRRSIWSDMCRQFGPKYTALQFELNYRLSFILSSNAYCNNSSRGLRG